jgi:murein DD-endopeptidase MepM/ murein hydrolase activator NlpD
LETLSVLSGSWFPERQILIRSGVRLRQLRVSKRIQLAILGVIVVVIGAGGALLYRAHAASNKIVALTQQLAAERQALNKARVALASLASAPDNGDMEDLAARAGARIAALEQDLDTVSREAAARQNEQQQLATEKSALQAKLGQAEAAKTRTDLSLAAEKMKLREQVTILEKRLKRAGKLPSHVMVGGKLAENGAEAEAAGGFDLDRFMAKIGVGMRDRNVGGPYVAAASGKVAPASLDPASQATLRSLPLAAPLDRYELESHFGVRTDPINGNEAEHTGVDLSAPYRSPVHSTAAGEVVFAGYAAAYGKMVEIDHGNGIHTRYAHLNRITANVGEHIGKHTVIGLLGSTGRSTGPHVHYEVLVDGVAQDPERFLDAGRVASVIKAAD